MVSHGGGRLAVPAVQGYAGLVLAQSPTPGVARSASTTRRPAKSFAPTAGPTDGSVLVGLPCARARSSSSPEPLPAQLVSPREANATSADAQSPAAVVIWSPAGSAVGSARPQISPHVPVIQDARPVRRSVEVKVEVEASPPVRSPTPVRQDARPRRRSVDVKVEVVENDKAFPVMLGRTAGHENRKRLSTSEVSCSATANQVIYIVHGQRYDTLDAATNAATAERAGKSPSKPKNIHELLLPENKVELEEQIKNLFDRYAGSDKRLQLHEMQGLAGSLALALGIPIKTFGELKYMFWRYDFSGDGELDEAEGIMLIEGLLKAFQDSQQPGFGIVSSLQKIPYKRLESVYTDVKKIGSGGQGEIYLAKNLLEGQDRVVKFYDKSSQNMDVNDIVAEVTLLTRLDHPKIARVYDIFQDSKNIYVINEPYYGGDFGEVMTKARAAGVDITYAWMGNLWKQACQGIAYLHSQHVMHLDIKEQNLMISGKGTWAKPNVVVIDFGLANTFNSGTRIGGTPGYMPPEVWETGLWTPKGDVFAMGVTMYRMLTARFPFGEEGIRVMDMGRIKQDTLRCTLPEPAPHALAREPVLRDLLQRMLKRELRGRPSFEKVLRDPWFERVSTSTCVVDENTLSALTAIQTKHELYAALLSDLASHENLLQLETISEIFVEMDQNNNGFVTPEEARRALANKLPADQIDRLIKALLGPSGELAYTAFMGQMIAQMQSSSAEMLWKLFKEIDANGDGVLDRGELAELLKRPFVAQAMKNRSAQDLLQELDRDGSGRVSWEEFRRALAPSHQRR